VYVRCALLSTLALVATGGAAHAMTMRVTHNQALLSGQLVATDPDLLQKLLDANPAVDTVVLHDSPGGAYVANRGLSELIQARKLKTVVAGHCVSACAMVFLSGSERYFGDAERLDSTSLGFHGSYDRETGALAPEDRLQFLKTEVEQETAGKADPALVDRWLHLSDRSRTVRFRYPGPDGSPTTPTVFDCTGPGPNRGDYGACTPIPDHDAFSMGIITSTRIVHVE
jgi:hypothetical protein